MKQVITTALFTIMIFSVAYTQQAGTPIKHQYLLIFRFKANFTPPSQGAVQSNIMHWQQYMAELAKTGALVGAYRPATSGKTISGSSKIEKDGVYVANNELVSSLLIINAASLDEAGVTAKKCPIFEFEGDVEIRPLTETAR